SGQALPLFSQESGSLPVHRHDNRPMPIDLAALDYALFANIECNLNEPTANQIKIAGNIRRRVFR
ncbi:MAG TPA: hypothetical protein VK553_10750, partial [Candidatus Nitrosopolaris rasttigaisensis]|nr:hypothetical protein [Candidatus Nitrosopolaris rasttigaisensis]